jgi:CRISPR-associated protein Csd1
MSLDATKPDRSYQFGRLLAVYEKMERDTFGPNDTREPNAIRLQSVYCNQPLHYAFELDKQMERA